MKFLCRTLFDITATGVTGHYKSSRVPFTDNSGQRVEDELDWHYARNQQRNYETLTQILGLRTQLFDVGIPVKVGNVWQFEFTVETPDVYGTPNNPTALLEQDAESVPMLVDLDNNDELQPRLIVSGPSQNIWFATL